MSDSEALTASERLNRHRGECGCSLGATAMAAAFTIAIGLLMLRYGPFSLGMLIRAPLAIPIAVVFALLGKVTGIAMGRRRARREVKRILARYTAIS